MTKEEFQRLTQNTVLLDGATGSYLMAHGMPRGICTELWIMEHKEILQELQKAYIDAGTRIVYAPTFSASRLTLRQRGLEEKLEEIDAKMQKFTSDFVKLNELTKEKEETEQQLEEKMERWDYLEELAQKIAAQ